MVQIVRRGKDRGGHHFVKRPWNNRFFYEACEARKYIAYSKQADAILLALYAGDLLELDVVILVLN